MTDLAIALAIAAFCGGVVVPDAHVTLYAPEMGGINCSGDCTIAAFGNPLDYDVGVACGPSWPWNTPVYVTGFGWKRCQDRGGAIDDDEVDVLVYADQYTNTLHLTGNVPVVWCGTN
jgi:3D (Asp-Asp-Asp) domain-containing protein